MYQLVTNQLFLLINITIYTKIKALEEKMAH
ncbi:hypothetical protein FHS57_000459 [Runella defluvii]|uniref:Uncharacterized protein n=1 Tax=Runella defluvii TaxID=370973 RepID=A0A7W6ENP6_9BACT|nr:hypothetical protein [Runella defluvii]